jgi:hypothetical protein
MRAAQISRGVKYVEPFTAFENLTKTTETIALYDFFHDTGRFAIDQCGHGHHGIIIGAKFVKDE